MAHKIEGNYAFFASETPAWHGLGTVLKDAPTVRNAWQLAYPFEVEKHPFTIDGDQITVDQDGSVSRGIDTSDFSAIVRSDGKLLSVMGKDYGLIPPYEIFASYEPLLESGLVKLEAGGSLSNGRQIWALGKIQDGELDVLPGDTIKAYILFAASYDGSRPLLAGTTGTRVVCANTMEMADRTGLDFRTKHTKNVRERLDNYRDQLKGTLEAFRKNGEIFQYLATRTVTRKMQEDFIVNVIAPGIEEKDRSPQMETKIRYVTQLLDTQRGIEKVPAMHGTAWQAYNAVAEYVTHEYGRNTDSRLQAQWFGESKRLNREALELATVM